MNDNDLIGKYIELRDRKAAMKKAYELSLVPIAGAMDTIANEMARRLLASGQESVRTENGTAYRSTIFDAKVVDRDAFIGFVAAEEAYDMLPASAVNEAIKEYMDNNAGAVPPGITTTQIHKTNFRKS